MPLYDLPNLQENKVHPNKMCFTVPVLVVDGLVVEVICTPPAGVDSVVGWDGLVVEVICTPPGVDPVVGWAGDVLPNLNPPG